MSKLSPAHKRFLTRIADPKRGDRRFVAILESDGHWDLFGALKKMGMLMRHPDGDPGKYIPTAAAAVAMQYELPTEFTELWSATSV